MRNELTSNLNERCEHSRKHTSWENGERVERWEVACKRCLRAWLVTVQAEVMFLKAIPPAGDDVWKPIAKKAIDDLRAQLAEAHARRRWLIARQAGRGRVVH
jgi:hypothetical protein